MWPFRSKDSPAPPTELRKSSRGILSARSIGLLGAYKESPNSVYTVVCQDNDYASGKGGARNSSSGRIVLLSGSKILWERACQRPNDGQVADNGTVAVADWLFTEDLSSKLVAYDVQGTLLLEQKFSANAFNIGLSLDGRFAAIQLCNSSTDDSSTLSVFDLQAGHRLGRFRPVTGWANGYEFDGAARTISLIYRNGRAYRFSFDGTFLDNERYQNERVADAGPTELVLIVRERREDATNVDPQQLLELLDSSWAQGLENYPDYLAIAHRLRGELREQLGQFEAAAAAYRLALALNSKIGVKKKLAALEKRLGSK